MTVEELIAELKKLPKNKVVEIGGMTKTYGEAIRVIEYENYVEIESNHEEM